jgi:integrase
VFIGLFPCKELLSVALPWYNMTARGGYRVATGRIMRARIGIREVRALPLGSIIWDAAVIGFGARRQRSDAVVFFLKYKTTDGRQRWHTIGRFGSPWTPDQARTEALRLLGAVVGGRDPAADKYTRGGAKTVAQLCDQYLADAEAGRLLTRRKVAKKASTLLTDRGRIIGYVKPLLGALPVVAVTRHDIEEFMHTVAAKGGTGTGKRTTGLVGGIFAYAIKHGMRADNPTHGVERVADGRRERRLSDPEYKALGAALQSAAERRVWPPFVGVAHFLLLTGWRSGEAVALRWSEVDFNRRTAVLPDTKTGKSVRPLSQAACGVLRSMQHAGDLIFPPARGRGVMTEYWWRFKHHIATPAGLPDDISPHTLRHSFASLAADLGFSEPTIASLLGHKGRSITSRYIHFADSALLSAADMVAGKIAEMIAP